MEAFKEFVQEQGFRYTEHDPYGLFSRHQDFFLFQMMTNRSSGLVEGSYQGHEFISFTQEKKTSFDRSEPNRFLATTTVQLQSELPVSLLIPMNFFDLKRMDMAEVETGDEVFDKDVQVRSEDPEFARKLLEPGIRELFFKPEMKDLFTGKLPLPPCLEIRGNTMLILSWQEIDAEVLKIHLELMVRVKQQLSEI